MEVIVACAFLCLCFWTALYFTLCRVNRLHSYEWNCRLVTLLHGISAICTTTFIGYVDGPWPFDNPGTLNTPLQISALVFSLGYFMFDMAWCVYFRTEGPVMLAHHTVSILGILLTLWLGESGIESCAVLFGTEITNPLLQTRWFLKQTGHYDTTLGHIVDILFVLLFIVMRVFVGGTMLYCELISPRPRFFIKCVGVAMYALSWIFVVDIVQFAIRKSTNWHRQQKDHKTTAVNCLNDKKD
ncbi:TLC domain-containing protein 5a [Periophthalmus magnuspinnatus]|uniref:TLC domain-containing protein n=1 Tax=Periophthalmus magnuspinnatus TaxID=409849 RepID=A0A3B4A524_9GOBI|nr:TLC domain-containing protein 5a [Periophthalmus magnuspinnatus]